MVTLRCLDRTKLEPRKSSPTTFSKISAAAASFFQILNTNCIFRDIIILKIENKLNLKIKSSGHCTVAESEDKMTINTLFANENKEATTNARLLNGTAELTNIASRLASEAIKQMDADMENYRDRLQASTKDMSELDKLIDELVEIPTDEADFLHDLSDETIEGMLKSQQSKRSRTKSKTMTLDNYHTLMTAAIAEHIIREVCDKPKQHGGAKRAGKVDYTPAELEALEADQEALKKEIRNIQSKKSIMKSKEGFDESDERYLALLKAEQMLKDLRVGGHTTVVEIDTTKNALTELLGEVSVDDLKAADAKELLNTIKEMLQ